MYLIIKYLFSAGLIVLISEIAKRTDKVGALIGALPSIAIITMIWLFIEKQSQDKINNYSFYTFWFVLPTLPMFLIFPKLNKIMHFVIAMAICAIITIIFFYVESIILKRFNIHLL